MSIVALLKVSLVAKASDGDAIMKALQAASVMHIATLTDRTHESEYDKQIDDQTRKLDEIDQVIAFLRPFEASANAIPPKGMDGKELFEHVSALLARHTECKNVITSLTKEIERYEGFGEFCESTAILDDAGFTLHLACLTDKELATLSSEMFQVVNRCDTKNYVALIAEQGTLPTVSTFAPPAKSLAVVRTKLVHAIDEHQKLEDEAACWAYQRRTIETFKQEIMLHRDRLIELKKTKTVDGLIAISGFVSHLDLPGVYRELEGGAIALQIDDPEELDYPPVKTSGKNALKGFQSLIRAFSGMSYFERDKSFLVSCLFIFFGAFCILDAGYGAMLVALGYVIAVKKNRDIGQICMWTGASAMLLGLLCGQVFGLVFAEDILINIRPLLTLVTDPMMCLKFSFIVGMITIAIATLCQRDQKRALGCVFALLGALVLMIRQSELFVGQFSDPTTVFTWISVSFFAIAMISWLVFPEPIFGANKRIANGLFMVYFGPWRLLQDVLSHGRLFGVALSGALLALVINRLCSMMPVPLGLVFAPVGHGAIFVVGLLSLYVHTNRLIFWEFGSKCMDGGSNYFEAFVRRV